MDSRVPGTSALTYEVKNRNSRMAQWLSAMFRRYKEIQMGFRVGAGLARVLPRRQVNNATQGAAIDGWLRMLVDPDVSPGSRVCAPRRATRLAVARSARSAASSRCDSRCPLIRVTSGRLGLLRRSPCWSSCTGRRRSGTPE